MHSKLSCAIQRKYPSTGTPSDVARWSCVRKARRNMTRSESYTLPSSATASDDAQPFSVMKMDFAPHSDCTWRGPQYKASGSKTCQAECIFGCDAMIGMLRYPGGLSYGTT